jgi:tRNA(Ile)-lysidine synthase
MLTANSLARKITEFTDKNKFLIAYSGGMDSHVLLHCMHEIQLKNPKIKIRAIHIHHDLSINADSWVKHCRTICEKLNIEFIVKFINIKYKIKYKHSLEALARDARYQEFSRIITTDEALLTAHHADDQAETVLLQLFRGSGPKGLAAMPMRRGLALGTLLRPLLEFKRADLYNYARQNNLHWVEDESNENIGYDRNFVRHKLMPIITERWPSIADVLGRTAKHCAAADNLLNILAQQDYLLASGSKENTLSISKLLELTLAQQNNLIRYWLQKLELPMPSSIKLQHVITDVLHCRSDAQPVVHWKDAEVRRYRDDLYAMKPLPAISTDLASSRRAAKYKVKGRFGTHSLKKLFQEKSIPPWQRNYAKLIFEDGKEGEELVDIKL